MKKMLTLVIGLIISLNAHAYFYVTTSGITLECNIFSDPLSVSVMPTPYSLATAPDTIVIPETVTNDGISYTVVAVYGFANDSTLKKIVLPNTVRYLGSFHNCHELSDINWPDSLRTIDGFHNCYSLTSVTFPSKFKNLPYNAFLNCYNLDTVIFLIDSCVRLNQNDNFGQFFSGYYDQYWNYREGGSISHVIFGDNVKAIPRAMFARCDRIKKIIIPESVKYIGRWAFAWCDLDSVIMLPEIAPAYDSSWFNQSQVFEHPNVWVYPDYIEIPCGTWDDYTTGILRMNGNYNSYLHEPQVDLTITGESVGAPVGYVAVHIIWRNGTIISCLDSTAILYPWSSHNYHFVYWSDGCTTEYDTVHVTGDDTVYAYFEPDPILTVVVNDTERGIISCNKVSPFDYNVFATSNYGYYFDHWSTGDTVNPLSINITTDSTIYAFFLPNQYELILHSENEAIGSVYGAGVYYYGDTIEISGIPVDHYHFTGWSDGNTDNPRQYVIWNDDDLTAYFAIDTYSVAVVSSDILRGSVSGGGEFEYATPCTVTATPYSDYVFGGWSNGSTANPYTFAVSDNTTLTAIFLAPGEETYTVTVQSADPNMGIANINGNDAATVITGTEVVVTATANNGFHFLQWNDGNTQNPRYIIVTQDTTIIAFFEPDIEEYTIIVFSGNSEMGFVDGGGTYNFGDTIVITATPYNGFQFVQWNDGDTSNPRSIIVNADSTFIAYFNSLEDVSDVLASNIRVYQNNGQVTIVGIKNGTVDVFDIFGRLVTSKYSEGETLSFSVQSSGIYFIKPKTMNSMKICVIK